MKVMLIHEGSLYTVVDFLASRDELEKAKVEAQEVTQRHATGSHDYYEEIRCSIARSYARELNLEHFGAGESPSYDDLELMTSELLDLGWHVMEVLN